MPRLQLADEHLIPHVAYLVGCQHHMGLVHERRCMRSDHLLHQHAENSSGTIASSCPCPAMITFSLPLEL